MKKFISLLLAFVMLFSIAVPAFAGVAEEAVPYKAANFDIFGSIINAITGFFNKIINFFKNLFNPPEPVAYYTITYLDADGTPVLSSTRHAVGSAIPAPAIPEKDGYVFMNWYPALPETMPERDIVVTAQWAELV